MASQAQKMQSGATKPVDSEPVESAPHLRLLIMGEFSVRSSDGEPVPISSKKNKALLAILALSPGQTVTREHLSSLLWGDHGEEQARNSLRQSLAVLRKELGPNEAQVIRTHDDVIALRTEGIAVDALDILNVTDQRDLPLLRAAAALYRGDLLADLALHDETFEEWLATERARLKASALRLFDLLAVLETMAELKRRNACWPSIPCGKPLTGCSCAPMPITAITVLHSSNSNSAGSCSGTSWVSIRQLRHGS